MSSFAAMRLDTIARLSLVRCRIPQLIPSHRMARHARALQQQAAVLSVAPSAASSSSAAMQLTEQLSIEESIVAHRRQAMGDLGTATASSPTQTSPSLPSPLHSFTDPTQPSQPLAEDASGVLLALSRSHSSATAVALPTNAADSAVVMQLPAETGSTLPESGSLSLASSFSPSLISDCPEPSTDDAQQQQQQQLPVRRCPSPAMSSFYLSPPLSSSSLSSNVSCPSLNLALSLSLSDDLLPNSASDISQPQSPPSASELSAARMQRLAQRMSVYREKERDSPVPSFSTASQPSSAPSLAAPKPRRVPFSHPYAPAPTHLPSSQQRNLYQHYQHHQQQQQRHLLAQHYLAAVQQQQQQQHSFLHGSVPSVLSSLVSASVPFPASFPSFSSPSPSFSPYLISTLPHPQAVAAALRV